MKTDADHKKNHVVFPIYESLELWEKNVEIDSSHVIESTISKVPSLSGSGDPYYITETGKMLIKPLPPDNIRIHIPRKYIRLRETYAALDIKIQEVGKLIEFII